MLIRNSKWTRDLLDELAKVAKFLYSDSTVRPFPSLHIQRWAVEGCSRCSFLIEATSKCNFGKDDMPQAICLVCVPQLPFILLATVYK